MLADDSLGFSAHPNVQLAFGKALPPGILLDDALGVENSQLGLHLFERTPLKQCGHRGLLIKIQIVFDDRREARVIGKLPVAQLPGTQRDCTRQQETRRQTKGSPESQAARRRKSTTAATTSGR